MTDLALPWLSTAFQNNGARFDIQRSKNYNCIDKVKVLSQCHNRTPCIATYVNRAHTKVRACD